MESKDPVYIASVKKSVDYAHSKGIEIGGYNLMASSRVVGGGGECLNANGQAGGSACLASEWSDDYFDTIKHFITVTGFDTIETDGPSLHGKFAIETDVRSPWQIRHKNGRPVCMANSA